MHLGLSFLLIFVRNKNIFVHFCCSRILGGPGFVKIINLDVGNQILFWIVFVFVSVFLPNLSFSFVDKKWYLSFSFFRTVDQMMIVAV